MIQDWVKYEAHRERLLNSTKHKFSSIDDDTFYDLFQDAYLEKFPVFEGKFDATKSNLTKKENESDEEYLFRKEHNYLCKIVKNQINDLLKSQPGTHTLIEIKDDDIYEDIGIEANSSTISFAKFLFDVVTQRGGLQGTDTENRKAVNKHYKIVTPLIKMEAWAQKTPLTDVILNKLSDKVASDIESEQFYDWIEPTPIVRLKSWVGCS